MDGGPRSDDLPSTPLLWDAHCGLYPSPLSDLSCLAVCRAAGIDHLSINVGYDIMPWADTLATLLAYRERLRGDPKVAVVTTVQDVERAKAEGRLAVSFDIEGANALNGDAGMVAAYRSLGVGQMLLAYNRNNAAAGGCHDDDSGLTAFGREVVAEMNRVGMIVDAAHAGVRTAHDLMACSASPVVFSHANARALCDHQRNVDDGLLRACASQGGVIGINGIGIFLGNNVTTDEAFADHVCHVADCVGPAHVAIGLDWIPPNPTLPDLSEIVARNTSYWPPGQAYDTPDIGCVKPGQLPGIAAVLRKRGWTADDIAGVWGGNYARLARQVWGN